MSSPTTQESPIVLATDLVKIYQDEQRAPVRALDGVNLTVIAGEFTAIAGPSGSGKTTLLNLMGGWTSPHRAGSVWSGGTSVQ